MPCLPRRVPGVNPFLSSFVQCESCGTCHSRVVRHESTITRPHSSFVRDSPFFSSSFGSLFLLSLDSPGGRVGGVNSGLGHGEGQGVRTKSTSMNTMDGVGWLTVGNLTGSASLSSNLMVAARSACRFAGVSRSRCPGVTVQDSCGRRRV